MTVLGKQVLYDYPIPILPYMSVYGLYGIQRIRLGGP